MRVRYTVPEDTHAALAEFETDPWVHGYVRRIAETADVRPREVLHGRHARTYSLPVEVLAGPGVDADRLREVTPDSIEVREERS